MEKTSNEAKVEQHKADGEHEQETITTRLYKLRSVARKMPYRADVYSNVQINWFVNRDEPPVPYHKSILDYKPSVDGTKQYGEGAVDELFTNVEAKVFAAYLLATHGDAVSIEEVALPIDIDTFPISGVPLGGGTEWYSIHKEPEYNLDFKVSGFFDIRGLSPIEESAPVDSGMKAINVEKATQTKRYLTIEDDIHRTHQQKKKLSEELDKLGEKMAKLEFDHYKCVKGEVSRLINDTPQGDQVAVDVSLLKEVLDYFDEYETGRRLPPGDDIPF